MNTKRVFRILPTLLALALLGGPAVAGSASDSWLDANAAISAPDTGEPDTPYSVVVAGWLTGGSGFSVTAWSLYEDATWSYTPGHMASVSSGTWLDGSGFNWGPSHGGTYPIARPAGTYKYTYIFGQRSFGHGWYDVAVDVWVEVEEACGLDDLHWNPPIKDTAKAGSTVPLKFVARDCNGGFLADEEVVVAVYGPGGDEVASMAYTGNPSTGVDITDNQYHANWKTAKGSSGAHLVVATFSTGDTLARTITLR